MLVPTAVFDLDLDRVRREVLSEAQDGHRDHLHVHLERGMVAYLVQSLVAVRLLPPPSGVAPGLIALFPFC